jgi:hypothetical protein
MDESEIQQRIQIEGPFYGCQLMRNNSGALKDATGRWVFFGLGNVSKKHGDTFKSSDLIGFRQVKITPEMVGQTIAVFTAIEVKKPDHKKDKRFHAQLAFVSWVKAAGGIAGIVTSVDEFKKTIWP